MKSFFWGMDCLINDLVGYIIVNKNFLLKLSNESLIECK